MTVRTCSYCETVAGSTERFCTQCGAGLPAPPEEPSASTPPDGLSTWVEPAEMAFSLHLPPGWVAQGGVNRNTPHGVPCCQVEACTSVERRSGVRVGSVPWQFVDSSAPAGRGPASNAPAAGGWFGTLGQALGSLLDPTALMGQALGPLMGLESLPFCSAGEFAQGWLLPRLAVEGRPNLRLVQVTGNPKALEAWQQDAAQSAAHHGLGGQPEVTLADVTIAYGPLEHSVVEMLRITTTRLVGDAAPLGIAPPRTWYAEIVLSCFAPQGEFDALLPRLLGVAGSFALNPTWSAQMQAHQQAQTLVMQADRQARQRQISQTLAQTSQIIHDGYTSREHIRQQHSQARHANLPFNDNTSQFSNAILGVEDRYDAWGTHYQVEAGHQKVWRDNHGSIHYGTYGTVPDPNWHELTNPNP